MMRILRFSRLVLFAVCIAAFASGCGGGGGTADTTEPPAPMPDPAIAQRAAISAAVMAANEAVNAVDNDSTDAQVSAADTAIMNARSAIAAATDVPAQERTANTGTVDTLAAQLAGARMARKEAMDAADMAEKMDMMETAMKLHAGIGAPTNDTSAATRRHAAYGSGDNAADIAVSIGTVAAVNLSLDKDAMVPAHYGWEGMKFTASPEGGGTYEAVVYSDVGEPTEGAKFNSQYMLDATTGELTVVAATHAAQIASASFDHGAGQKKFPKAEDDVRVIIPGSFHGVSGTYYCTPATSSTCAVQVAANGFTLGGTDAANAFTADGGAWTFKPGDAEARLMDAPDNTYVSYGWWIHKAADGKITASAFEAERGTVPDASGIGGLIGTATYEGGAAGKYALRSMTGGTNDAGHFTAEVTLKADFIASSSSITGTIDNFMGADGQPRDWSVELKEAAIATAGGIARTADKDTAWTINGTAAADSGEWKGRLQDNGTDLVPRVVTGTFYTEFGGDGKMVGAFGAKRKMPTQ